MAMASPTSARKPGAHFPDTVILRLRFRVVAGKTRVTGIAIVPCWISSSHIRNEAGILRNDYQPRPVFGAAADHTAALIRARSAPMKYGVKQIDYLRLRVTTQAAILGICDQL
jgi:hypothetical protein